jgi:coenzyme F420 hydrogenase subunit beta
MVKSIDKNRLGIAFTNRDLCTRCGTCIGICPTDALSVGKNYFPVIDTEKCIDCGLCMKTCPGGRINFRDLTRITFGHNDDLDTFDGHVAKTIVGYAGDEGIRRRGAGGGIITALALFLLQEKLVDGCIVTRMDENDPLYGRVYIARNRNDLLSSQQSKYQPLPVNSIFQQLKTLPGIYAYIGLPCHIHGYRLLSEKNEEIKKKIRIVIGLFCGMALEPHMLTELLKAHQIRPQEVKAFQFRGGEWPGKFRAVTDKKIHDLHYSNYKDGAFNYLMFLYSPRRCQTCIDGSSQFSDLSVSDAWTRDQSGNYLFRANSRVLARTRTGLEILQQAISKGAIRAQDISGNQHYKTHQHHTSRKGLKTPLRVARLNQKNKAAPVYDRTPPPASGKDKFGERVETALMSLGRHKLIRYPLLSLLMCRYGIPLVKLRQYLKSRKYKGSAK